MAACEEGLRVLRGTVCVDEGECKWSEENFANQVCVAAANQFNVAQVDVKTAIPQKRPIHKMSKRSE